VGEPFPLAKIKGGGAEQLQNKAFWGGGPVKPQGESRKGVASVVLASLSQARNQGSGGPGKGEFAREKTWKRCAKGRCPPGGTYYDSAAEGTPVPLLLMGVRWDSGKGGSQSTQASINFSGLTRGKQSRAGRARFGNWDLRGFNQQARRKGIPMAGIDYGRTTNRRPFFISLFATGAKKRSGFTDNGRAWPVG